MELYNRFPLEIRMDDVNGNEKFFLFEQPLPREECKPFYIRSGDVILYGDSGLVIFYDDLTSPYSCTKIGKIIESSNLKRSIRQ